MLSWLRNLLAPSARGLLAGVDVSSYQGPPASWRASAGAISWAAVKLTEFQPGGIQYVNPDAAADWAWLRQTGKGRIAYLFGHPSVSVAETVELFVSELDKLGLTDDDGVALDLEVSDGLAPAEVDAWAAGVLGELAIRLARRPLLYTFISFAEAGNCARLGDYPLWIADPSSPAGHPRVPAPWKAWAIQQYEITGPIDRDVANYASLPAMFAALGRQEELDLLNLGGSMAGGVATARWPDGVTVIAGYSRDGYIRAIRWDGSKWGEWINISPTTAIGPPSFVILNATRADMYYPDNVGSVIQISTSNTGLTWT